MSKAKPRLRSIWVFHLNTGACNGCDIEILDVLTPYYDAERFGIKLVGSPRHADALLVTGPLTRQTYYAVKRTYEAMPPRPRIVIAVGTCACSGGIFYDSHAVHGGIDKLLPVDIYIPGCPPRPEEILYGIAQLLNLVEKKVKGEIHRETTIEVEIDPLDRVWHDLREELRKVVGYFDRDQVLEDFKEMLFVAYRRPRPLEHLKSQVDEYCRRTEDPRLCFVMKYLYAKFIEIIEGMKKLGYNVEDLLRERAWREKKGSGE